eukprot:scaffold3031_cov126-Isochrysis_galbana.AAC.2
MPGRAPKAQLAVLHKACQLRLLLVRILLHARSLCLPPLPHRGGDGGGGEGGGRGGGGCGGGIAWSAGALLSPVLHTPRTTSSHHE